jgi:hypothetical protein
MSKVQSPARSAVPASLGIHVQPMTPAHILEAEALAPARFKTAFAAMRAHGIGLFRRPIRTEEGILMHPAREEDRAVGVLTIARCRGLGPEAFHPKPLHARIAIADLIVITAAAGDALSAPYGIAIARAIDGNALLVESPARVQQAWLEFIEQPGCRAEIMVDRVSGAADAAHFVSDAGTA